MSGIQVVVIKSFRWLQRADGSQVLAGTAINNEPFSICFRSECALSSSFSPGFTYSLTFLDKKLTTIRCEETQVSFVAIQVGTFNEKFFERIGRQTSEVGPAQGRNGCLLYFAIAMIFAWAVVVGYLFGLR